MKRPPRKNKATRIDGLEGCYIQVEHTAIRLVLKDGRYKWGARDIYDSGTYAASQPDEFSCVIELSSEFFRGTRKQCRMTRRGKTYTVKVLPNGEESKFKRYDDMPFLEELRSITRPGLPKNATARQRAWKQIQHSSADVSYYLTGESVVRAATFPVPPSSKTPTVVRVSHSNSCGRVDSDVFVRLGDPQRPLDVQDFDTVSDWQRAKLVEDLLWSDEREKWVLKSRAKGSTTAWCGTYEAKIYFPKGHHQIEFKIISRVSEVCSIVLSNWKVYVR